MNSIPISPKVIISYSHDSREHKDRVLQLADQLREDGIDCNIHQYYESDPPPQGWPRWANDEIDAANFVLIVCTELYNRRFRSHENKTMAKPFKWTYKGKVLAI
ncbi:toll/interleukin-1 receptor domain-containing protein [Brasilonema bromeliae]|nr:toll/interleukin-1 receptor domain-containing protein [Brasilonema bromeliae]